MTRGECGSKISPVRKKGDMHFPVRFLSGPAPYPSCPKDADD